jgi:ATP-dependent helicase/nuclease subunit A
MADVGEDKTAVSRPFARQVGVGSGGRLSAAAIGTAHHAFLQFVDLNKATALPSLAAEARRLERQGILTRAERDALDLQGIAAFWSSSVGKAVLAHAGYVRRELPFTVRLSALELRQFHVTEVAALSATPPRESPPSAPGASEGWGSADEFVVVTGAIDLAVLLDKEVWTVDFKTDAVNAQEWELKAKTYEPQMHLYATALSRIYRRPVTRLWLHSLVLRSTKQLVTKGI